jgi:hypothetical protein
VERRTWRLVVLATQTPLTRVLPAPHAARTVVTILSGCWTGASGTACADDASVKAKATAIILIMGHTPVFELTPHRQLVLGLMLETIHPACRVGPRARDVRFGSKADICAAKSDVRFAPNSDRKSVFPHKVMSALPPKADICSATSHVCYGPKADIDGLRGPLTERFSLRQDLWRIPSIC